MKALHLSFYFYIIVFTLSLFLSFQVNTVKGVNNTSANESGNRRILHQPLFPASSAPPPAGTASPPPPPGGSEPTSSTVVHGELLNRKPNGNTANKGNKESSNRDLRWNCDAWDALSTRLLLIQTQSKTSRGDSKVRSCWEWEEQ